MAKSISISIITQLDPKGARDAERLLAAVSKAQVQAAQGAAKVAQADARVATSAAQVARAQSQAAAATTRAATESQRLATASANTARAQTQASAAALRYQQAQERATRGAAQAQRGMQQMARGLGGVQQGLAAVGVAVGAQQLVSYGADAIRMAAGLDTAKRSLMALAGTPKLYASALAAATEQQRLFGGSLEENISGIQGLITVSRSSGVELSKLIDLTQRLSIKDPAQGIAGARIALNEALAGDPTSLAKRYEIPRAALRALRDESTTAQEKLAVLDQYLSGIGITSEVASGSVSPLAVTLNELGAAAESAQTGIGLFLAQGSGLAQWATGLLNAVGSGLTVISTVEERLAQTHAAILDGASSYDDYRARAEAAADQLGAVGLRMDVLTESQYALAQSLHESGTAWAAATQAAQGLEYEANIISNALENLQANTGMTDAEIRALSSTMLEAAASSDTKAAALAYLADQYIAGTISAEYFQAGVRGVIAEVHLFASGAAIATDAVAQLGQASAAAKGGLIEAASGASIAGQGFAAAAAQGLGLLNVMNQIAGRAAQAATGQAARGPMRGFGQGAAQAAGSAALAGRIRATASRPALAAAGAGAGAGGAARISEAEQTADRLVQIEQDAAKRLMEIDARLAQARVESQRRLAATLLQSANDFAVESQVNDLDAFGDLDEAERQRIADREAAEAKAREAQKRAIDEATQIAVDGDAELAEQTYQARQDQIRQQQQLDEAYAAKQREVGEEQQGALAQQYQEATDAIDAQTGDRIGLAQAEAAARAQAVADEKAAVIAAAGEEASALLSTGSAASTATGQVNGLSDALRAIPTSVTTTVTVRTVQTGGGTSQSAPTGGGTGVAKAAGGADFVTTGPMTLNVGDNPGGVERVTVTPISGRGQTRISGGAIHLAGGGVVDAGGTARARLDAGTSPTIPAGGAARAVRGGAGGGSAAASATDALEAEATALQLMLEVLDLRERVAQAHIDTGALDYQGVFANQLRRLGAEVKIVTEVVHNRLVPLTEAQAEAFGRYADAAEGAQGVIGGMLDLRGALAEAGDLTTEALDYHGVYADQLRRLGAEAKIVTEVVNNRLAPLTEAGAGALGRYVEASSASLGLLSEVLDLRRTLAEPQPALDMAQATSLANEAQRVTGIVQARLLPTSEAQAEAMGRYADAVGSSVAALRDTLDLRQSAFADYTPPSEAQLAALAGDAQRIVRAVDAAARVYDADGLEAAQRFADALGGTVSAFRDTLAFNEGLLFGAAAAPDPAKLREFAAGASSILDTTRTLATQAQGIPAAGLAALTTATAAITAQADAMIRLAAVPFADLPRVTGAFGASGAGSVGGVTVNVINPPANLNVPALIQQVKDGIRQDVAGRR